MIFAAKINILFLFFLLSKKMTGRRAPHLYSAAYVMFWEGRKLLLSKRLNTGFKDRLFGLPGGHLNPGESPIAAAVREVRRALGATVRWFTHVKRFCSDISSLVSETSEQSFFHTHAHTHAHTHTHTHTHKHTHTHTHTYTHARTYTHHTHHPHNCAGA